MVPLHAHVPLLASPDLAEQVRGRDVTLATPGVDVRDGLGVFAHVEETAENKIVHTPWAHLNGKTSSKFYIF